MKKICLLSFLFFLVNCSSSPTNNDPAWVHGSTRIVDNGYIVYVEQAQETTMEKAQFKAEGLALEDLANECSFIPKGTRIEDRYISKNKYTFDAYVKLGLEFKDCEEAKHAVSPDEIKKYANVAFMEQLKKYQDLVETGEIPPSGEAVAVTPPGEIPPAPSQSTGVSDTAHFYAVRQYVAYQKEIVILSPPAAYPPNSPQTQQFVSQVQPASNQIQTASIQNPKIGEQAYSRVPDRPAMAKPAALAAPPSARRATYNRMQAPPRGGPQHSGREQRKSRRRRRNESNP